jgi:hypothetical protein
MAARSEIIVSVSSVAMQHRHVNKREQVLPFSNTNFTFRRSKTFLSTPYADFIDSKPVNLFNLRKAWIGFWLKHESLSTTMQENL